MKITTNNHARELVSFEDLPADKRGDFDYIDGDDRYTPRLFAFRGEFWDTYEFESAPGGEYALWHGVHPQSYFDAVVIRYTEDYEAVVVGHATW